MTCSRLITVCLSLLILAGCEPVPSGVGSPPAGVSQADQAKYERHKSNRESYMYQGL